MLTLLSAMVFYGQGNLWLPAVFSDNMVLQRERPIPVFGTARPGEKVSVRLGVVTATARAGHDGAFRANLKALPAGGPYQLSITASGESKTLENVMVGEVWVASGQSNMEWPVAASTTFDWAKRTADPMVRMIYVPHTSLEEPARDFVGSWQPATPSTVGSFSAVGYYFAQELASKLRVPVGVIHTSWGGTPAESWTSRPTLTSNPRLRHLLDNYLANTQDFPAKRQKYEEDVAAWRKKAHPQEFSIAGNAFGWEKEGADESGWETMSLPATWEDAWSKPFDGAVWFRRQVTVTPSMLNKELTLSLGPIDDGDMTFFNGEQIGTTSLYNAPRVYKVPARLLKVGENTIAVRVYDSGGGGGIYGKPEEMFLTDGNVKQPLHGPWQVKVEAELTPVDVSQAGPAPQEPFGPGHPWVPGGLYNGMIAPLIPYGIRGAIWYQGESNAGRAYQYRELFPVMIRDWRKQWGQGDFPFYFVQLANFMARNDTPVESAWAELREAQSMTLTLPNTGQAVTIDIGEANDIHPRNKLDVGRRLAYWALAKDYGKNLLYSGPLYRSMKVEGAKVRLRFDLAEGLRTSDGRKVVGFSVAGSDRKFVWADATIEGDSILVSSTAVPRPVAVRYGWSDNPDVNLVNRAGLPASPFRTDSWPGTTINNK